MGTNYYWVEHKVNSLDEVPEEDLLHIGKRSAGWVFHFEAHEPNLMGLDSYIDFLKYGYIYDEYDRLIPYTDFIQIIRNTLKPFNNRPPYSFTNPCPDSYKSYCTEWMDNGFMFSLMKFV